MTSFHSSNLIVTNPNHSAINSLFRITDLGTKFVCSAFLEGVCPLSSIYLYPNNIVLSSHCPSTGGHDLQSEVNLIVNLTTWKRPISESRSGFYREKTSNKLISHSTYI